MILFLNTLNGRAWRAVVAGWKPLMIIIDGHSVPKSEVDRTDAEEQAFVGNSSAMNVFKIINSRSYAKKAWKILEVAYEGTTNVKISIQKLKY